MTLFVPQKVLDMLRRLQSAGHAAYLVGGALRDLLMGRTPKDFDLATSATPDEVESCMAGLPVHRTGEGYGVVTVEGMEIATFRHDEYQGLDPRKCRVCFTDSVAGDLRRRDLTVNAMAWDPLGDTWVDPFCGRQDVAARKVRMVGHAPSRFREDPSRILRACHFLAAMEGGLAADTAEALRECAHLVALLPADRVRRELVKALGLARPSLFFRALADLGILDLVLPSLAATVGLAGGSRHGDTVFEHCLRAGDAVGPRCPLQRLAAYLHDVGRAVTAEPNRAGEPSFPGHASAGAMLVARDLEALNFPKREVKAVSNLVRMHMESTQELSAAEARRVLHSLNENGLNHVALVRQFVVASNANLSGPKLGIREIRRMLERLETEMLAFMDGNGGKLAINGHDLMVEFGLEPGPMIGKILIKLTEHVIQKPEHNNRCHLFELAAGMC